MKTKFYDCEVFPNWWCVVVSDLDQDVIPKSKAYSYTADVEYENIVKANMRVYTSENPNDREKLLKDLSTGVIMGYNIKRYDNIIIKLLAEGFGPKSLYIASDIIIHPNNINLSDKHQRIGSMLRFGWSGFQAVQDLMDDSDKSLKDKEASFGIDIRETTVPFGKEDLTPQEIEDIIFYCKHDVFALHIVYLCYSQVYVDTKLKLAQLFNLPEVTAYQSTNAVLAGKVLCATRAHGTTISDPTITIHDKPLDEYFRKYIPAEIYAHLLTSQGNKTFQLYENKVTIGDGGLHSVYQLPKLSSPLGTMQTACLYAESTDEYTMYNVDASSCYTSVMLYCSAMSRAIKRPERLKEIYQRRIKLKFTPKSKWTQDDYNFVVAAKLVLNTTYGAMGNKYLPLYDDYMRSKVCRVGQMVLIALANAMFIGIPGLKVFQNNTDGILVYIKRSDYDKLKIIVDEFSKISNFLFETEEDSKLWQLNVNNYVALSHTGEVKAKGGSFVTDIFQPGTNKIRPLGTYAIPKAHIDFLVYNNNPLQNILSNVTVSDLVITCTKGSTYYAMTQLNKTHEVELGKVARVIAIESTNYGKVVKRKIAKGVLREDTCANCPQNTLIVNDSLSNYKIIRGYICHTPTKRKYKIDYGYYVERLEDAMDVPWIEFKNNNVSVIDTFTL